MNCMQPNILRMMLLLIIFSAVNPASAFQSNRRMQMFDQTLPIEGSSQTVYNSGECVTFQGLTSPWPLSTGLSTSGLLPAKIGTQAVLDFNSTKLRFYPFESIPLKRNTLNSGCFEMCNVQSPLKKSKISLALNANEKLIQTFYEGFQQKNYQQMGACYADNATFQDPVFNLKNGKEARAMWQYLITNGKDLTMTFRDIKADDKSGTAHWEAIYSFSATGRKVHNVIEASFEFENGKIIHHRDHFKFWKWTRMALGATGTLLGWTPLVKNKVRKTAASSLKKFMADKPEYQ